MLDKMFDFFKLVFNNFERAWVFISAAVIGVLVIMFKRRGDKLEKVIYEKQKAQAETKLKQLDDKIERQTLDYANAKKKYLDLKRKYSSLISKYDKSE